MRIITDFFSSENLTVESKAPSGHSSGFLDVLCRVLVIDDDPSIQRLIQQSLSPQAVVIQELDAESDYIQKMEFEGIDAVILDYKLPGKDGLEVLKLIREQYEDLPVLFMTGFGDLELARRAIAAGANEYFPKPFDASDLRFVVSKWVPKFDASRRKTDLMSLFMGEGMGEFTEAENFLTAKDPNGEDFTARVIRYNSRAVIVETGPDAPLSEGTPLENTRVTLGFRSMEVVGAVVQNVTKLSERTHIEIGLPGVWRIEDFEESMDPQEVFRIIKSRKLSNIPDYSRFDQGMRERRMIPESYRATITDVESILEEFYDDLEPFEKLMFQIDTEDRSMMEQKMIEYAEGRFFPELTKAMNKFEEAADSAVKEGLREEFSRFAQKRLFPLILCSPFFSRVVTQPIGVPGDFGILGQLLGHPYEGHSLYGRILNAWAIKADPSAAYRHRINLLGGAIEETVSSVGQNGEKAKILSMASGVAYEVQRFVMNPVENPNVDFELVDFSSRTLLEAKKLFSECKRVSNPTGIEVILKHGSVVDLAQKTRQTEITEAGKYDLVYCAGLFDYLSERMCSRVVSYLYGLTKPGGKVIVSNYTPKNSLRYFMGIVLDWELIHRSPEEFDRLMKSTAAKDHYRIVEDETRTELYAIADKP